jgi:hypothetical protein
LALAFVGLAATRSLRSAAPSVSRGGLILELQNPDVLLASLEADRDVTTAEASALELETRLGSQAINEEATVALLEAELSDAERRAAVYGADIGLVVPKLDQTQMEGRAQSLTRSLALARQRVKLVNGKGQGAIAAWRRKHCSVARKLGPSARPPASSASRRGSARRKSPDTRRATGCAVSLPCAGFRFDARVSRTSSWW